MILESLENRIVPAAPTNILLSKSTIPENSGTNVLVGKLTTEDKDLSDSFNYSFQSGPGFSDNSSFIISGSELRAATNFNSKTKEKEWAERMNNLIQQIQYWIINPTEKTVEIVELYY